MSKLFVNGCSISLGAELGEETRYYDTEKKEPYQWVDTKYRREKRWSTLLSQKLNTGVVNISRGAGSNPRTWRTTLDFFNKPQNIEYDGIAVIQLTGPERFQIPINERFLNLWEPTYPCEECDGVRGHHTDGDFNEWAKGGVYSPDDDDLDPVIEEYSHWNQHSIQSLFSENIEQRHFVNMKTEVIGNHKFNSPIHQVLDTLRYVESLVYFFRAKRIPCYMWDALGNLRLMNVVLDGLKVVEESETCGALSRYIRDGNKYMQIIDLFCDGEEFWGMDKKIQEKYYLFLRETKLYDKIYNKINSVKSMPEMSQTDFGDMFLNKTHPSFVGKMPGGHPDEKCHEAIATKLYDEIMEKKLWSLR